MLRLTRVFDRRVLIVLGVGALMLALAAPAAASDRSIFKSTQTYVSKGSDLTSAWAEAYDADDFAAAADQATKLVANTKRGNAALIKDKTSSKRGKTGKRILLSYWTVKLKQANAMVLAAQAGVAGDLETAQQHISSVEKFAEQASGLLNKGIAYFK